MKSHLKQFLSLLSYLPRLSEIFAERFDRRPISTTSRLTRFIRTRAAYIAQQSLYGYLKTRMGTKFPQYFEDEEFSGAIRAASLKLYVSCLSDLTVFSVAILSREAAMEREESVALARECFRIALQEGFAAADNAPIPADALDMFAKRVEGVLWANAAQGENAFSGSAGDIVAYAPVIDEFKRLDGAIVRNSIRYRWRDIREQFRRRADARGVLEDWRGRE